MGLCPSVTEFKVWKTIRLGTGLETAEDFRESLEINGMKIGNWASDILGKPEFTVATKETKVNLVVVTVEQLGFKNGATREQIYTRAKELGLELCPPEVGPQLRLQYKDQPINERLVIATEPICGSDGYFKLFGVECDCGGLWLGNGFGSSAGVWGVDCRFVFVRRK